MLDSRYCSVIEQDYAFLLLQETADELYEESVHEELKENNKDLLGMANDVNYWGKKDCEACKLTMCRVMGQDPHIT